MDVPIELTHRWLQRFVSFYNEFWVHYVLNSLEIVIGILNYQLVASGLIINVVRKNWVIQFWAKSHFLVGWEDKDQSQLGSEHLGVSMGLEADCESSDVLILLVIKDKVVPESIDVNFRCTIDEES